MTPILVNGVKFAGCVIVGSAQEDAFRDSDKLLIQDLASMLGANIYAKRMRRAAEKSNVIAREMLHSMIPRAVIAKIEVFWDKSTQEYRKRRSLCLADEVDTYSSTGSSCAALGRDDDDESVDSRMSGTSHNQGVSGRIEFLHQMSNAEDDTHSGCIVDTSTMRIGTLSPGVVRGEFLLEVMDMMHALFSRFDALCDKHGVQKLETVGDAYLCTTNLFDGGMYKNDTKRAALHALKMAKDMVLRSEQGHTAQQDNEAEEDRDAADTGGNPRGRGDLRRARGAASQVFRVRNHDKRRLPDGAGRPSE
ncbi:hypothetical protein THAOC_01567 [Thalassiosira oceanica]|uniref:Guanylate cyclase domain-containing protein n=1 Tax=Thalassiosira oceanica TaxID=159749 RepID=K0TGY9_THAOC|nr:hypothetical protein THAOC_01567 [Thalassiosira oceanica]|eukprot:EJK76660.1 hypothetical protein THAOC_01567 [Thalassiosira oceanica]